MGVTRGTSPSSSTQWTSSDLALDPFQLPFRNLVTSSWLTLRAVTRDITLEITSPLLSTGPPKIGLFTAQFSTSILLLMLSSMIACVLIYQLVFLFKSGPQRGSVLIHSNPFTRWKRHHNQGVPTKESGTAGISWCLYMSLGVKYYHNTKCHLPWLEERREWWVERVQRCKGSWLV